MGAVAAIVAIGTAQVITTLGNTAADFQDAQAAQNQFAFQREIAGTNARIANIQAEQELRSGAREETNYRKQVRALIGSQRARLAAQGQDLESGSALDIQADTASLGAQDALIIRNDAFREAFGFKVQALNATNRGQFADISSRQAGRAARGTILTGGLEIAQIGLGTTQRIRAL